MFFLEFFLFSVFFFQQPKLNRSVLSTGDELKWGLDDPWPR